MTYHLPEGSIVIGIDLGTTNSACYVYDGRDYRVVKFGDYTILPSYAQFKKDGSVVCGTAAKNKYGGNGQWVVSNSKRIIGRPYNKAEIHDLSQNCGVPIVNDHGIPKFNIENQNKFVSATEVATEIIKSVIQEVKKQYPGKNIDKVVVTTPAYFDNNQKAATIQAAMAAGFARNQIDTLNEPTAAAICYGLDNAVSSKKILVYDLGGGTFDVSILDVSNYCITVLTTGGDNALGGVDVDKKMMELIMEGFEAKFYRSFLDPNMDDGKKARYVRQLQRLAEESKINLSNSLYADVDATSFDRLNQRIKPLIDRSINLVKELLQSKSMSCRDIDHVILVGGSSNLCIVYDTLKQMFGEEKLKQSVNPSECVAKGGCMSIVNPIKREEITSYSLGSTIKGNQVTWVLPKHSKIPAEYSERFANSYDNQTTFSGFLVQGESLEAGVTESLTDSMTMLKRYVYSGVTPMPMGQSPVRETYYMKEPDIVLIDAVDELSGKKLLDHAEFVCN
ncbi:molecular chaperone DnaK [Blastocystis sp. ATCC 50177/Nand II]|uniref:Molecular chaperone DnaK n=1 Tax=Blastocystis sp. subtype 1 (strain ATCC 50177 / NandII) TaxID=478820 RepID=A0A196SDH9_BLAHN|nr:molecular chaperone DnaK [Blastocystis sp. ATCC 50177/Nand II]